MFLTDCLLVCPPRDTTQFYHEYPLLGVGYIASALHKAGIHAVIEDPVNTLLTPAEMARRIASRKPRIIGFSVIYNALPFFYGLTEELRKAYPQGLIVAGGPQITSNPEIIRTMGLKYGLRGDAEMSFAAFCNSVLNDETPDPALPGLVINTADTLTINNPAFLEEPDSTPFPDPGLYNLSAYKNILFEPAHVFTMITSRGCPYDCVFCDKLFKTRYRHNSTDAVINHIKKLVAVGIKTIEFVDESFTLKRRRIVEFCNALNDEAIVLNWGCWTRADLLDAELLELMKKSGLKRLLIGVETGSESMRFAIKKKITNQQFIDVIHLCNELNIITECTFILGHPGETEAQMNETIDFAMSLNPTFAYFYKLNVVPASELFERYKSEQGKDDHLFENFMLNQEKYPFYTPQAVNDDTISAMAQQAYRAFYNRPSKRHLIQNSTFLKHRFNTL